MVEIEAWKRRQLEKEKDKKVRCLFGFANAFMPLASFLCQAFYSFLGPTVALRANESSILLDVVA